MKTKSKKTSIKLNEFDFITINSAGIQLNQIDIDSEDSEENGIVYNASFILWISDNNIPIFVPTGIYDECEFCTISQAMSALLVLTDTINDTVLIFDDQGNIIEELSLDEIFDDQDESEPENTDKSV